MIALRLFSLADPSRQIDVRVLGEREEITLGRDASADWPLHDPDRALSRLHLKVGVRDGAVSVTDTSTNGVTSAAREERLPRDRPVRVEPGERLELGPYALLIERSDHVAAPPPSEPQDDINPFAPRGEVDETPTRRRLDPFASGMAPDPLAPASSADDAFGPGGLSPGGLSSGELGLGGGGPGRSSGRAGLSDGDVWTRREDRQAGDWNVGTSRPEPVIGAAQAWTDPPAEDGDDRGFGFDAPFRQPMLRKPDLATGDLAIPSDWDSAPAGRTPPTPAPFAASPFDAPESDDRAVTPDGEADPGPRAAPSAEASGPVPALRSGRDDGDERARAQEASASAAPAPIAPSPAAPAPLAAASSAPASAAPDASSVGLFEAFCTGARLDPAAFAGEDQAALMARLGAVYRHMVLGLSDVLGERTALKNEYRMVRTTIRADENNPFKWAPPQKVASELLRSASDGFLDGPAAVAESYQDVKKHLLCMLAGLRAALSSSLDALAPGRVEEAIKDQSFVLKPRAAVAWGEYVKLYGEFRKEAEDSADSPVNRAFRAAYEKQLDELDRMALR